MSSETFKQRRSDDSRASTAAPVISPGVIDFGTVLSGETETRSFLFSDTNDCGEFVQSAVSTHGTEEITISLSESPSWFQVVQCEQLSEEEPSQLRFTIAAKTANLPPGQRYDGWIMIHGRHENARAMLTIRVADAKTSATIQRLLASRTVQAPLLFIALLLLLAASAGGSLNKAFVPWRSFAASDKVASSAVSTPLSNEDLVFALHEENQLSLYFANSVVGASQRGLGVAGWSPAWSPDGAQVAYISDVDGLEQIYVLNVKTGLIYQLSDSSGYKLKPKWSPDGLRLAFIAGKPNQGTLQIVSVPNAYIETLDEAERAAILDEATNLAAVVNSVFDEQNSTSSVTGYSRHFDWSPDGHSILFDVHDGDTRRVFVATSNSLQMLIDSDVWSTPVWSPDGEQIVAASNIGLYLINAHGEEPRKLNALPTYSPTWSKDGEKIAFLTGPDGENGHALWVMDADGQNAFGVAEAGVVAYSWSPEGDMLAYITGNADLPNPTLYLWVTQMGQMPRLVAEVGEPALSWRNIKL